MPSIAGPCERYRAHTYRKIKLGEPCRPRLCNHCEIVEALSYIVPSKWFGARWWCGLIRGHDWLKRDHKETDLESWQCQQCGEIRIQYSDMLRLNLKNKEIVRKERLVAKIDPEWSATIKEVHEAEMTGQQWK